MAWTTGSSGPGTSTKTSLARAHCKYRLYAESVRRAAAAAPSETEPSNPHITQTSIVRCHDCRHVDLHHDQASSIPRLSAACAVCSTHGCTSHSRVGSITYHQTVALLPVRKFAGERTICRDEQNPGGPCGGSRFAARGHLQARCCARRPRACWHC